MGIMVVERERRRRRSRRLHSMPSASLDDGAETVAHRLREA
jgi:hypothetical protein